MGEPSDEDWVDTPAGHPFHFAALALPRMVAHTQVKLCNSLLQRKSLQKVVEAKPDIETPPRMDGEPRRISAFNGKPKE